MLSKANKEYIKYGLPVALTGLATLLAAILLLARPLISLEQANQQASLEALAELANKQVASEVLQQDWLGAQILLSDIAKQPAISALALIADGQTELRLGDIDQGGTPWRYDIEHNGQAIAELALYPATTLRQKQLSHLVNASMIILVLLVMAAMLGALRQRRFIRQQRQATLAPLQPYLDENLSARLNQVESQDQWRQLLDDYLPELRLAGAANKHLTSGQTKRLRRALSAQLRSQQSEAIILWADIDTLDDQRRQRLQQLMHRIAPLYEGCYSPIHGAIIFAIGQDLQEAAWQAVCCAWVIRATLADDQLTLAIHSGSVRHQVDDYCGIKMLSASGSTVENGQRMPQFSPPGGILISEPALDLLDNTRVITTIHRDMPLPGAELMSLWLLDDLADPYGSVLNRQAQQLELG